MGWYADTQWELTFHDEAAVHACAAELRALDYEGDDPAGESDREVVAWMLAEFNEESSIEWDEPTEGLHLSGWGTGKAYDLGPDMRMVEWAPERLPGSMINYGGYGVYAVLARYAKGVVDWSGEDSKWRIRFHGDGRWVEHLGTVTYPSDSPEAGFSWNLPRSDGEVLTVTAVVEFLPDPFLESWDGDGAASQGDFVEHVREQLHDGVTLALSPDDFQFHNGPVVGAQDALDAARLAMGAAGIPQDQIRAVLDTMFDAFDNNA